ncbi:ORF46 [White spot syndrome virus]|uniref:Wsv055 n=3 Tax=White spot syndrome virus TaxID=342409 RepID=Q77J95_WSSVS|nr:wsv055 [Shrimp white spot syndrome virus]AAK77715.1 ORF46 [White spot syndrome virus]AYW76505.1 hypothetical protein [Procambarus clarkii virus]AAL33059.1 wsv055 [Shrimp white spot syndrome virus]AAL88980.1 WSSV112 [Shrimp white spot syndrome virus]AFX59432.1 wsv055 [White spot syndrome virus]
MFLGYAELHNLLLLAFYPSSPSQKLFKNFSAHSSLGGGPLTRPYVKFEGWTAGSTQRQITERG